MGCLPAGGSAARSRSERQEMGRRQERPRPPRVAHGEGGAPKGRAPRSGDRTELSVPHRASSFGGRPAYPRRIRRA